MKLRAIRETATGFYLPRPHGDESARREVPVDAKVEMPRLFDDLEDPDAALRDWLRHNPDRSADEFEIEPFVYAAG